MLTATPNQHALLATLQSPATLPADFKAARKLLKIWYPVLYQCWMEQSAC